MAQRDAHVPPPAAESPSGSPPASRAGANERPREAETERTADPRWQGRGPKGYRRSDERIREDVCERLLYDPHLDSSEVTVQVQDGCVVLEGSVTERRMKHAIEDTAAACAGVVEVENRIKVLRPAWQSAPPFLY